MYAIIKAGGKQYKVKAGDVLRLEKMEADLGAEIQLTDVLAIGGDKMFVGEPTVKDAKVTLVVTNQRKGPKVIIFKKKRRQGYRRLNGHRQLYTEVFVKSISGPAGTVEAEGSAQVFDPAKKQERMERKAAYAESAKQEARKAGSEAIVTAKPAAKKKTAKPAAKKPGKKAAASKAKGAKKAAAKGTKKAAGTTKKKTSK